MTGQFVSTPITGFLNRSGNFDGKFNASSALYSVVQLVGETSGGAATWLLRQGALPVGFSQGNLCESNQLLLAPSDQVEIIVSGGTAGAQITGQLVGKGYTTEDEAIANWSRSPNPQGLAASIAGPVSISGNVPVQNASGSQLAIQQGQLSGGTWGIPPGSSNIHQNFTVPTDTSGRPTAGGMAVAVDSTGADTDILSLLQVYVVLPGVSGDIETLIDTTDVGGATILYTVIPAFTTTIAIYASAPSTNTGNMDIVIQWLPPGIVNVAEIINTPGNPVYVNLAQPSNAWAARDEPGSGLVGPTVTHTPPANQSSYVTYATGGLLQQGTTAFISFCRLLGTINGVPSTIVWEGPLGVEGVLGDSAQCPPFSGGAIKFDPGTTVTLGLSGMIATGVIGMLSMLGYDQ